MLRFGTHILLNGGSGLTSSNGSKSKWHTWIKASTDSVWHSLWSLTKVNHSSCLWINTCVSLRDIILILSWISVSISDSGIQVVSPVGPQTEGENCFFFHNLYEHVTYNNGVISQMMIIVREQWEQQGSQPHSPDSLHIHYAVPWTASNGLTPHLTVQRAAPFNSQVVVEITDISRTFPKRQQLESCSSGKDW